MIDWQAENEALLAGEKQGQQGKKAGNRRLWLLFLLVFLLFLLPAGFWGYRQVQARNRELARQAVEEQYLLLREAAILGDAALFTERNGDAGSEQWLASRDLMVTEHSWLGREPLGLAWEKTGTPAISVTLSTDGREADLTTVESYTPIYVDNHDARVQLTHNLAFKWENNRWVYQDPGSIELRREYEVAERPHIRLFYPPFEAETAGRLADDFNALVAQICTELADIQCADQIQVDIQLSPDLFRLLNPAEQASVLLESTGGQISLPSPGIVGRPADEAAYVALRDGYAPLLVREVVSHLAGRECCDGQVFFEALLDRQLRTLGLPATLPTDPDLAHLVRKKVRPDDLYGLWGLSPQRISSESLDRARAVVGFMSEQSPDVSTAEWLRRLAAARNYQEWAGGVAETNRSPRLLAAWLGYLYSHSNIAVAPTSVLPDQNILLLCSGEANSPGEEQLYRYQPAENALGLAIPGRTFHSARLFSSLDNGILVAGKEPNDKLAVFALENGSAATIWETSPGEAGNWGNWHEASPLGSMMYVGLFYPDAGVTDVSLLDISACRRGNCDALPLPEGSAPPVWSPDEQHFLFVHDETLYLESVTTGAREIVLDPPDFGYYDFVWLDNNTYAYSRIRDSIGGEAIVRIHWTEPLAAQVGDEQPAPLFDPADLLTLLPADRQDPDWAQIRPHPLEPGRMFVIYEFWEPRAFYVLSLERNSGAARLVFTAEDADTNQLTLSPNGRWFSFSREGQVILYDTLAQSGTVIEDIPGVARPVWSPDSQWLFILSENVLHLFAPLTGENYRHLAPDQTCSQGVWAP